jgi:Flp pilus assembly protein TadG
MNRVRSSDGSAPIELLVMTPVIVILVGLAVFAGRVGTIRQDVISASRDSARAAAARQFAAPAASDGQAAAERTLASRNVSCRSLEVDVDTGDLVPGGAVTATVTCDVDLSDVTSMLGLPGSVTIEADSTVVIDRYRGGGG